MLFEPDFSYPFLCSLHEPSIRLLRYLDKLSACPTQLRRTSLTPVKATRLERWFQRLKVHYPSAHKFSSGSAYIPDHLLRSQPRSTHLCCVYFFSDRKFIACSRFKSATSACIITDHSRHVSSTIIVSLSRLLPSPTTRSALRRPIQMPSPYLLDNHSLLLDLFSSIHPDSPTLVLHERTPYPIKFLTPAQSSSTTRSYGRSTCLQPTQHNTLVLRCLAELITLLTFLLEFSPTSQT